ncbi:putative ribonuclease H-like domain-containing protein, partial [Tanacetum coccineum]
LTRFGRAPVSAAKQSSLRTTTSTSTFRPVNTATHINRVNVSKLKTNAFHKSHSPIRRSFYKLTAPNTKISNEKVNTVRVNGVNTAGQIAVSTVKGTGITTVKVSACCVWRPKMTDLNNVSKDNSGSRVSKRGNSQQALKNKGIFDGRCSRHMTGNKDFLTDYQDFDGGFVAFGGSARGVFFSLKLKCLVLSLDFKLLNKSQVLLRVPRQSNMYSFDLKNVVPSGDLTCLFAKATIDESKLWHRRLQEPTKIAQALNDESWVEAMQEELLQFKIQKVWTLVDLPYGKKAIGTKWVYRNKKDERGIVVRNRARVVAQGYKQEEGIDYDEVIAPVARIEAIRLFFAYASFMNFLVYQMDVKSAFLYGTIEEEVYVSQPLGFMDPEFPEKVYKVEKALYGLHQAPRAWYETLSTYLLDNGFYRGQIDKTLFIKRVKGDILLVQVYVDDIIFGSTKKSLCTNFEQIMHKRFQMSSMGELTFFLGLQVKQKEDGIFISQDKYVGEILKKFGFSSIRTASTPMETNKALTKDEDGEDVDIHLYRSMIGSLMYLTSSRPDIMFSVCACSRFQVQPKVSHLNAVGLWYPKDSPFILEAFLDSDYAGASLDRKSTTGGCQFLGSRLISWQCKKQTVVANSTTEAEYIAASHCCGQVLWIQNQMLDYGYNFMQTKIHVDNESAICVVKNPVYHSKTKHIEIRHHFIRDSYEKKLIEMVKIHTDYNVADLLTKAFDVTRYRGLYINECWLFTTQQMVINSPCLTDKKELAIPGQTTTGKESSNPLMANSLPRTILPTKLVG